MAWTYKQADDTGSNTAVLTTALTSGSLLVACARTSTGTPTGISDTTNGTWTNVWVGSADGDNNTMTYGYFWNNAATASETFTLLGSPGNTYFSVAEYTSDTVTAGNGTEVDRTTSINQTGDGVSSTTSADSGALTVPAGDIIAVGFGIVSSDVTVSAGGTAPSGSWALRTTAGSHRAIIQDIVDVGTGSCESAPTWSGNKYAQGALLLFGEESGGAATPKGVLGLPLYGPLKGPVF